MIEEADGGEMKGSNAVRGRHERIEADAGDYFARRQSPRWTAADEARFNEWLAASPLHRVAYLRVEHAWERAERLKALRTPDGTVPPPERSVLSPFFEIGGFKAGATRPSWARRHHKSAWSLAAGLAAAIALPIAWLIWPQASVYRTPVGGLETVPLADGSTITLNTDSAVRVAVSARERRVTLERGEAFFEVAKDPKRPFVVQAGDKRVIAVGTQFSVWRDTSDNDIQVVVTEGTVRLEGAGAAASGAASVGANSSGSAAPRAGRSSEALLPAGTVAHAGDAGVLVQRASAAQAEDALSWRQGILVFRDTTLADAIAEFNRYNVRQVVIDDPEVGALKVAGNFRATNVEGFVRLLEKGYPIRTEERDGEVILKAR